MTETPANVIMLKGLRLNMFDDQLYNPQAELTTKGKHEGKWRFNWGAKFILPPKDSAQGKQMLDMIRAAAVVAKKITWGDQADEVRIKGSNMPFQDGDDEEVTTFSAHKGAYFLSASKTVYGKAGEGERDVPKRPFRIIGPKKVRDEQTGELRFPDMKVGQEGAPYSGCFVNLKCEIWGQKPDSVRGIAARMNATILAVQFKEHGDPFGGGTRTDVDNEFDEEGDDDFETGGGSTTTTSTPKGAYDDLGI